MNFTHAPLFTGINGFGLAAEWLGWKQPFHCEIDEFCQRVIQYYWPNSIPYYDIKKTSFKKHRGTIDVVSGGFPCQPYSHAGKRKGKEDERHLWPEMLRAIREIKPIYVVGENVFGLLNWNGGLVFNEVQTDLENEGYEVWPVILPACAVNAPHKRERIWFVAYNSNARIESVQRERKNGVPGLGNVADSPGCGRVQIKQRAKSTNNSKRNSGNLSPDSESIGIQRNRPDRQQEPQTPIRQKIFRCDGSGDYWQKWPTQQPICGRNDGLSSKLDGITFPKLRRESIQAYGNAIVPQVAYEIFKAIEKTHEKLFM